ncbi:unnamed protein product [Toxocara canis]|uniref:Mitochondrial ornithine transporter 1 n=1 Tax=Toxocara canis TaxID=6265 RepID=A0A183UJF6_TOXCA|nr:unnamed protein product [Toxocara canis]
MQMEQFELEAEYFAHNHLKDGIIDLTAGTIGGIANVYSAQPLDTVKVKMQTFPELYKSAVSCFKDTFRLDGIKGLYAGTVPALVASVAENAVLFTAYGCCQKVVGLLSGRSNVKDMSPFENACSGSLAAVFAALVLCPTELVKCRLQSQREMHPNKHRLSFAIQSPGYLLLISRTPMSICREMYRTQGVRSFFVGMTPTLAREVPGYFFFFGAYEVCRYYLTPHGKTKDEIGVLRTATSGGVGGMALWASIFPADVVKSRMQIAGTGRFSEMFISILKNEGIRALYKGLAPTLLRTCIASGCLFVSYEYSKKLLTSLFP